MRFSIIIFCFCCLASCGRSDRSRTRQAIEQFARTPVQFPAELEIFQDDSVRRFTVPDHPHSGTLVMYYAADKCSSCILARLGSCEKLFSLAKHVEFIPMIVLATDDEKYENLISTLRFYPQAFPLYIDRHDRFGALNPHLPEDSRFHTLLLDRNDRVVLAGNPLDSDAMWNLFVKTVNNMAAHDGEYLPEK